MSVDWDDLSVAFLHDPLDKALSIRGHVPRARDNARIALGDDARAAVVELLPMPKAGEPSEQGERAVGARDGRLHVIHPLSGKCADVLVPDLTDEFIKRQHEQLRSLVQDLSGDEHDKLRNRLLAAWRLWPERLAANCDPCFDRLPADTRTPDHTIWNHLDVVAALKAATADGHGAALLAFALGPVQRFIEAARSVRDLWSGSMILSWLAFQAMLPVIERLGPTALIYPALRGNPLLDLWLRDGQRLGNKVNLPEVARCLTPSLPHRFLALVPWGNDGSAARELASQCQRAVCNSWREMAEAVRGRARDTLAAVFADWDKRWDGQINNYFSASTVVVPLSGSGEEADRRLAGLLAGNNSFADAFGDAGAIREMARAIPSQHAPSYPQDHAGRWQYQVELVSRALAAQRSIRHVPRTSTSSNANARFPRSAPCWAASSKSGRMT